MFLYFNLWYAITGMSCCTTSMLDILATGFTGYYSIHTCALYVFMSQKRLSEFTALTHALVNFTSREDGNYIRRWNGQLSPMAEKLLQHHALLNDVDALQQACM